MTVHHSLRRKNPPNRRGTVRQATQLLTSASSTSNIGRGSTLTQQVVRNEAVGGGTWYPATSTPFPPQGTSAFVHWTGGKHGWLRAFPGAAPQLVEVVGQVQGGPTGLLVNVTPSMALQQQATPEQNPRPMLSAQYTSPVRPDYGPAPACAVDLDALALVCADTSSPLHGAEIVSIMEGQSSEPGSMVTVTFIDPRTQTPTAGQFAIAAPSETPWWKHDGHCCESCALGSECEGDECSLERVPNPQPRRRIFSR